MQIERSVQQEQVEFRRAAGDDRWSPADMMDGFLKIKKKLVSQSVPKFVRNCAA
jgi:hypothetical protein